jgi:hypothetical protein
MRSTLDLSEAHTPADLRGYCTKLDTGAAYPDPGILCAGLRGGSRHGECNMYVSAAVDPSRRSPSVGSFPQDHPFLVAEAITISTMPAKKGTLSHVARILPMLTPMNQTASATNPAIPAILATRLICFSGSRGAAG